MNFPTHGHRFLVLTSLILIGACSGAQTVPKNPGLVIPDRSAQRVPNQMLVRFRPEAARASARTAKVTAKVLRRYSTMSGLQLVELQPGVKLDDALAVYRSDPTVLYAEPNYIRRHMDNTPNDPYYHDLWSLHNIGQPILFDTPPTSGPKVATPGADIHALQAWAITTGSSDVVVGVIDTGVDYTHEDLAANMYRNTADCNNNGVDDDGNGYIDDCYGIDVLNNTGDPMDKVFHGTHVAGIIGAVGNNGIGVTGVNWNVKILACRFLDWYGGTDAGAIACFDYMATMHDLGVNIVATNNSWGGYGYSQALYDTIVEQEKRGILTVAAAGNEQNDNDGLYGLYPATYALPNIISVASTTFDDSLSYFSNFGAHTVHLGAPGEWILSTTPANTYTVLSGTSMATPHVTGVAALLKAQDPKRDWATIKNLILAGGDPDPGLSSTIAQRRLNAYGALTCSNSVVQSVVQPSSSTAFADSGQAVTLAELNTRCGVPAGNVQVTVSPGGPITLTDDGVAPDRYAGDSVYSASWTPAQPGLYTLTFPAGKPVTVVVDPYSYSSAAYQYRTFTGTKLSLAGDNVAWIEAPFAISFGGGAYAGLYVSENGWMSFDSYVSSLGQPIPYRYAQTLVAPFWDDLVAASGGDVFWTATGTAPNRELVVEWRTMSHAGCKTDGSETVTFQVVLFENQPDVLVNYRNAAFGGTCTTSDRGATASIGMQMTTTVGKQLSLRTGAIQDSTAYLWKATLPTNTAPTIKAVNPTSWYADIFDTYIELTGTNFSLNAVMLVNGSPRETYVFTSGELIAILRAADLPTPGTLQLSVFNGLPGGGPSAAVPLQIRSDDFQVTVSVPSFTIKTGQSASATVNVNPNPVYNDAVTLTCSGLPANATCTFDPGRILPLGYSVMTITTKAPTATSATITARSRKPSGWPLATIGVLAAFGIGRSRKRTVALAIVAVLLLALYSGCGGGGPTSTTTTTTGTNPPVTPQATSTTYTVTITGTSGSLTRTRAVSVTLTP